MSNRLHSYNVTDVPHVIIRILIPVVESNKFDEIASFESASAAAEDYIDDDEFTKVDAMV